MGEGGGGGSSGRYYSCFVGHFEVPKLTINYTSGSYETSRHELYVPIMLVQKLWDICVNGVGVWMGAVDSTITVLLGFW